MRQRPADTVSAVLLALALHVALLLLLVFGLSWTRSNAEPAFGSPVTAELFDPEALSAAQRRALEAPPEPLPEPPEPERLPAPEPVEEEAAPPPQPLPQPMPEDAMVDPQPRAQERMPEPDTLDQDAARREAESELAAEREQEERRRQEQIDLTERERQEEAEQQRRLARQQELEKLRAERERLRREAELAEQKLKQIADARARQASEQAAEAASPPPGRPDGDSDLAARYAAALQEAIARNWVRPDNVPLGQTCRLYITQLPGGQVMSVEFDASCPFDALGRRSVEAAVRKAEPLPYRGFEPVFARRLNLNFTAQDR
ncbi:TonB C-terminal domain-containing protein [Luteimonas sp. RD2P54]|uniref:TonB C-terminal domain-containing protein n=1 Tax=Luteimonas endophytica TaxID=3042023 RepID=A0ABT6J5Z8_9GAMM|nr:TonB C-terminal domain-containing protein [Luteimonas endophytica]MDH5822257.1 TonB C-terminal domain-containing protein [Luteimonas endophytica]